MEEFIMVTEKMTVHKALAELKILDSRINKTIYDGIYCGANKHSSKKIVGIPIEDFQKNILSNYDKVTDLISRHQALKRAVTLSNAVTKVEICGKEYTVAESIWMKNHGIEKENLLAGVMTNQYNSSQSEINRQNGLGLEKRADDYVTALYGGKEGKNSAADAEKTRQEFIDNNSYELIDPIHVLEKIEILQEKTADFMAEVDAALSVSNSLTEITIEY